MPGRIVVGPPRVSLSSSVFHDLPSVRSSRQKFRKSRARRELHAVALRLATVVERPPLGDGHLPAARVAVRRELAEEHLRVGAAAVGLRREAEVVGLEAGADAPEPGVPGDVAAVLVEPEPAAPARQRRGLGVDRDVGRVGALVVALRRALQAEDGRAAAGNACCPRARRTGHPVAPGVEEDVAVDAAHEGALGDLRLEAGRAQVAQRGGRQHAERPARARARAARGPRSSSSAARPRARPGFRPSRRARTRGPSPPPAPRRSSRARGRRASPRPGSWWWRARPGMCPTRRPAARGRCAASRREAARGRRSVV